MMPLQLTQEDLIADFMRMGLKTGDVVFFHASLSQLGHVIGGANAVIDALLQVVGPEGTIAVPTIVHTSGIPRDPFDVKRSDSEVGAITEALRQYPDAIRSNHPTHSVAALGAKALELTSGHAKATGVWTPWGKSAFGVGSPWDMLYRWNARYLLLGVGFEVCTMFHYVQTRYVARHQPDYAEPIPFPYFCNQAMGEQLKQELSLKPHQAGSAQCWLADTRDIVCLTQQAMAQDLLFYVEKIDNTSSANWLRHTYGRSLKLRGAFGSEDFNIPQWPHSHDGTQLKARVCIIENDAGRFVLVSLTVICLNRSEHAAIRAYIAQLPGMAGAQIMITCTHVHSGVPLLTSESTKSAQFIDSIGRAVCSAVRQALASIQPIRLAVADRSLAGLTRIRRARMNDGRVYSVRRAVPSSWRCEQKPEFVDVDGELDTNLTVLRIEDSSQNVLGCLFHFTTHPIPDLHGYAADWLEQHMSDAFTCVPLNGAMGDVDTCFDQAFNNRFENDQLPDQARVLYGAILELLGRAETKDGGDLKFAACQLDLAVDSHVIQHRSSDPMPWIAEVASRQVFETDMLGVRLGPLAFVGIPGELASKMGLLIRRSSPFVYTCPIALANDQVGYLMSRESRSIGGYETDPSQWALTAPGSAEKILESATRLLHELKGKP